MFYVATNEGFLGSARFVRDIRMADPFSTFQAADDAARATGCMYWAVLKNTI